VTWECWFLCANILTCKNGQIIPWPQAEGNKYRHQLAFLGFPFAYDPSLLPGRLWGGWQVAVSAIKMLNGRNKGGITEAWRTAAGRMEEAGYAKKKGASHS
jgi:hypothetical protein